MACTCDGTHHRYLDVQLEPGKVAFRNRKALHFRGVFMELFVKKKLRTFWVSILTKWWFTKMFVVYYLVKKIMGDTNHKRVSIWS